MPDSISPTGTPNPKMTARNVSVFYGDKKAIDDVSIDVDRDNLSVRRVVANRPFYARSTE